MKRTARTRGSPNLESFRRMLADKRVAVLANLGARFDGRSRMGRLAEEDEAQVSHEEFISLSLNHIGYQQLGLVEEALERIQNGDYGKCLACGDSIPEKRLKAVPWARYCVPCQERIASGFGEGIEAPGDAVEAVAEG